MFGAGLSAKRLELLRAVVPKPKLIGVLVNPNNPNSEVQLSDLSTGRFSTLGTVVGVQAAAAIARE
jgi:hypothetical protein